MRKDRDNPLALSSKKPCQGRTNYGPELERLCAELEAERSRTQRARGLLCVELRHLREDAEREEQRAVRELTARRGCQTIGHSNRHQRLLVKEVNVTDGGQYIESTGKEAFCLHRGETYTKLEQLLLTLYEKINGEQAGYKLHHRQDLELEKAVFLCHLLEAHGRLLQGRKRAGHLRKPTHADSSYSYQTQPPLTCSLPQRSHSESPNSPKKRTKQDQGRQPSGRAQSAADPCTTAAVVDTCWSSSLKICHPPDAPNAGWDDQPPCCAESSGSHGSPPSKCMDRNMESPCGESFLDSDPDYSPEQSTSAGQRGQARGRARGAVNRVRGSRGRGRGLGVHAGKNVRAGGRQNGKMGFDWFHKLDPEGRDWLVFSQVYSSCR